MISLDGSLVTRKHIYKCMAAAPTLDMHTYTHTLRQAHIHASNVYKIEYTCTHEGHVQDTKKKREKNTKKKKSNKN